MQIGIIADVGTAPIGTPPESMSMVRLLGGPGMRSRNGLVGSSSWVITVGDLVCFCESHLA